MEKLSSSQEDYLEAIYLIKKDKKSIKSIEIARRLNVKKPSVTVAVKKLAKKGFLNYKKYNTITMTGWGEKIAKDIYKKHEILLKFFVDVLKIKKSVAEEDACKIEHTLSKTTLNRLTRFIKTVK
ncbi:metal-dependent transcriptional regulator [Candidatus Woesearchaeota archaeon]|nr:metal-dependent transcriptional regulator [Candidatus Woesearchaeota archaeon]